MFALLGRKGKGTAKRSQFVLVDLIGHIIVCEVWSPMLRSVQQGMKHALNM